MERYIVVDTEDDEAYLIAAGLENHATIVVSDKSAALSATSSIACTEDAYVVYVVGTPSEQDRFFKDWLVDANCLASRSINRSQGSILPASPSIEIACKSPEWLGRLTRRLYGDRDA
jgi:hypothetical protein